MQSYAKHCCVADENDLVATGSDRFPRGCAGRQAGVAGWKPVRRRMASAAWVRPMGKGQLDGPWRLAERLGRAVDLVASVVLPVALRRSLVHLVYPGPRRRWEREAVQSLDERLGKPSVDPFHSAEASDGHTDPS